MQWLRAAAALLHAGEPEPEVAVEADREPDPGPPVAEAAAAADGAPAGAAGAEAGGPPAAASAEDLRRAAEAGAFARVKLAGARALPARSTVRRGGKEIFVILRGALAAGRPEGVIYGPWAAAQGSVQTRAGNLDSGAVFHGFRTTSEAAAYWQAAVGGDDLPRPWPLLLPGGTLADRR